MGLLEQSMKMVKFFIDTGTDPNLTRKSFIHPTWAPHAKQEDFLKLKSANEQPIRSEEVLLLTFKKASFAYAYGLELLKALRSTFSWARRLLTVTYRECFLQSVSS